MAFIVLKTNSASPQQPVLGGLISRHDGDPAHAPPSGTPQEVVIPAQAGIQSHQRSVFALSGYDRLVREPETRVMTASPAPSATNRVIDAAALLLVLGGIGLFAFARAALTGIGNGTRAMPEGISAVAVTDFHVAQSSMGLFVIAIGVLVGVVAAVRHKFNK
jgi:hypothetical protein